ncbi:MAG: hypothetical protein LBJ01_01280 [Tannerella sp.]|jgi:hypothetical protein|nr:hypothetical protein [Tannerella sp.]
MEFLILAAGTISDVANLFLSLLSDVGILPAVGSGITFAFALGSSGSRGRGKIPDGVRAVIRRWHGGIDDRFANIDNLVGLIESHQPAWSIPSDLLTQLAGNRSRLQALINKCRTPDASTTDRTLRDSLLKATIDLCLENVKTWAYGQFFAGVLTADDVHLLGFMLPGEHGGYHGRAEPTDALAEVKVEVINADFIRATIDNSAGENAAQVVSGWPPGVGIALIVITSVEGNREVYRQMTTHLRNDIRMPEGSHGEQFVIKAAFLKHVDDEPRFGNEPTFAMPRTTEDLAASLDRQHQEEFEAQKREIEQHRREIERLQAEINAKKGTSEP